MMAALMVAAALAGTPLASDAGPDGQRLVRMLAVEGVPGDAAIRAEFLAGFDAAIAADSLAIETRDAAGAWRPATERRNRFILTDDPKADDAWTLQVVVRAPPPFGANRRNRQTGKYERHVDPDLRVSRGMTLAVTALSPEAIAAGARVAPEHFAFAFPQAVAPAGVVRNTAEGFRFPWRDAGRVAATLALELLHHHSGEFDEATRCDLSPAVRAGSIR